MNFSLLQKKIRIGKKLYYVFYLIKGNAILRRLGYIMHLNDAMLVKINLQVLFIYLFYYKGFVNIKETIYLKFFILSYFFLLETNSWRNLTFIK